MNNELELDENIEYNDNKLSQNTRHKKVESRTLPEIPETLKTPKISKKTEMYEMDSPQGINLDSNNQNNISQNLTNAQNDDTINSNLLRFETVQKGKSKEININKLYSNRRPFSKFKRKLIFILIFILNILINLDHGAIPAGTTALKQENSLDNVQLGIIGSLVYLGLILGSISAGFIYSTYSSKWVLVLSLFSIVYSSIYLLMLILV